MWRKLWSTNTLKYVAAFLVPAIFLMFVRARLDNDSYFMLAEGRYLAENGIHYSDVLTIHEELNLVVQNYGFVGIFYFIYSVFGAAGLYTMLLLLNFLVCFLIYKICLIISNKNTNLSLLIMVITNLLMSFGGFITTRAQMVDYILFLSLIYILELYIKTGKSKYLWWMPIFSLLQINLHASMWWMLFLVLGPYIIDGIHKPKLHLQGYKIKPLIIIGIISFLMGFINPYGIKMISYIFTSYGAVEITSMVNEMRSFNLSTTFNVLIYMILTVVLTLYIFGNKKRIRIRYLLMFFGFLALGLNSIKGMSQFILVLFFPLALIYKDLKLEDIFEADIAKKAVSLWGGITAITIFMTQSLILIPLTPANPGYGIAKAMDAIELSSNNNKEIKIYVGYNNGGYVEFRGYKAYLDPRAEIFLDENNGKENILKEWEDMIKKNIDVNEFLKKYDFDYLIANRLDEEPIYTIQDEKYEIIYENTEEEIRVFKNIKH